jgi:hypothetical protein
MINNKTKYSFSFFLIILLFFLPFVIPLTQQNLPAIEISDSSIGFYQSNTCKISFLDIIGKNISQLDNIRINPNSYPEISCQGYVTGLDKSGDDFILSVGLNANVVFLIQSFIWLIIAYLFSSKKKHVNKISSLPIYFLSILFLFQHFSEERFYRPLDNYYDLDISISNLYLINYFLSYLFIFLLLKEFSEKRNLNILYFIPVVFIFTGTYYSLNLNFYLLFFAYFGVLNIYSGESYRTFNYIYFLLSIFWIFNVNSRFHYFNTDKLRGFINSSNNLESSIFWIIIFYLFINGLLYFINQIKEEFSLEKLKNVFLISGVLMHSLGLFGTSNLGNFFNYLMFGQNKKGMNTLTSVAGNTWRGFSPSAELIGEFYGVCLIIVSYCLINSISRSFYKDLLGSSIIIWALVLSNNVASISSTIAIVILIFLKSKNLNFNKKIILSLIASVLCLSIIFVDKEVYDYSSSVLIQESILHSDLFQYEENYKNTVIKRNYFKDKDYLSLLIDSDNYLRASTSINLLTNIYTSNINIPFIPNVVGMLSVGALLINRVELWGIFVAKYSPNFYELLFGYGPNQMTNYLLDHNIRLDFKEPKASSLFLPHSSLLDLLLYFGVVGLILITIPLIKKLKGKSILNNIFIYILIFLIINYSKSDSVIYIQGFILIFVMYLKILIGSDVKDD